MAVSFESNYVILLQERSEHVNDSHVDLDKEHSASKFQPFFNLTSMLALLAWKTFRDSHDYQIIEQGYKRSHGYFYIYIFKMKKVIGVCLWGYKNKIIPDEICIYFSWKEAYADKVGIISAHPFSRAYYSFLKCRKNGMIPY